jgi:hypothetical protein
MASRRGLRRRWTITGAVIALLGAAVIIGTIIGEWGRAAYGLGVVTVVLGCVIVVVVVIRRPIWKVIASVVVAGVLVAGGVLVLTGIPKPLPQWDSRASDGLDSWSARTGDLLISGGTAYDVETGDVVWEVEGDSVDPMLVRSDTVVLGTRDETIALETSTGRELWRSPIAGPGITSSGDILVISHVVSDTETEAVALELTTGEIAWRRPGRPVMECDLGPADRFSVAPESSHVLVVDEIRDSATELLAVADGSATVADVDCSLTARIIGDVLLEARGETLIGRSVADGAQLWATQVNDPWIVEGGGSDIFTASQSGYAARVELEAIDVATGQTRSVEPPVGRALPLSGIEFYRTADVWVLLDVDSGGAVWNPSTDALVEIPDADSVDDYSIDVHSGWMALTGSTRDVTGETSPQCWALSPTGELFGPAPGPGCYVDEGILQTGAGIYPLQ